MGFYRGPRVKLDGGLILNLDAGTSRSYPGTGTAWYDLSSEDTVVTLVNTPTFTSGGKVGGYFSFNGADEYATVTSKTAHNNLNGYTNSYTIEMWLRSADPTTGNTYSARVLEKRGATGAYPFSWQANYTISERLGLFIFDGTNVPFADAGNTTNLFTNIWRQVVMVVDFSGDKIIAYRDGINVNEGTNTTTANASNTTNFYIANGGALTVHAAMDMAILRIYNTALTATQVKNNFNAMADRFSRSQIA